MNILLIEPRYYTSSVQSYFPIGPSYIAAVLKQDGHTVHGINANLVQGGMDHLLETISSRIEDGEIDAVAMGGLCTTYEFQKTLFHDLKQKHPHVLRIIGGNLFSAEPDLCFTSFHVDYGIKGEGEVPAHMLFNAIEKGTTIDDIPGLYYKKGQELIGNRGTCLRDTDQLPMPEWEMFVPRETIQKTGVMPLFTSRSCPFHCTFCYHPGESFYRRRSVDHVMAEVECLVSSYGIHHLTVNDELFALDKSWTEAFCKAMQTYKNHVSWECQIRVNNADRHILSLMKSSGCNRVSAGFESGSDTVLTSMKKKATVTDAEHAASEIRAGGFCVTGGIILGDFAETPETIAETVAFIKKNALIPVSDIGMVVPYPGSAIYERCVSEGLIPDKEDFLRSLGYFSKLKVNMTAMDDQTLLYLQEKASEEIYDWTMKTFRAKNVKSLPNTGCCGILISFTCPTCGSEGCLETPGDDLETVATCQACFYPVMIHPKDQPKLTSRLKAFEVSLSGIERWDRVVITPAGHDALRMSALLDLPVERILGFMDASPMRMAHPFMGKPVYQRIQKELNNKSIETILVISNSYASEIQRELESHIQSWQQVITF